jgi:hypothetical protein
MGKMNILQEMHKLSQVKKKSNETLIQHVEQCTELNWSCSSIHHIG